MGILSEAKASPPIGLLEPITDFNLEVEISPVDERLYRALEKAEHRSYLDRLNTWSPSGDKTSTAGSFTISFPTADASNAVIRIA